MREREREQAVNYDAEEQDVYDAEGEEDDDGDLFEEDDDAGDDDDGDDSDEPRVRVRRPVDPNVIFARVMGDPTVLNELLSGRIPTELLTLVQSSLTPDQLKQIIASADPQLVAQAQRRSGSRRAPQVEGPRETEAHDIPEPPVRSAPVEDISHQQLLNELGGMLDEYLDQFEGVALGITFQEGRVRIATYVPNPDPEGEDQSLVAKKGRSSRFGDALHLVMEATEDLLEETDDDELVDDD